MLFRELEVKEDILNVLIDSAEARYEEMFGSERNIGKIPKSREEFIKVTMGRISEATTRHQLDGVQRMFAKIIKGMMKSIEKHLRHFCKVYMDE